MIAATASYSSRAICEAAGVTYRMLDHWCRLGLIRPSIRDTTGSGTRREWSAHDLAVVRVLGAVAGSVRPSLLGQLVGFLDDLPLQQWAATTIVIDVAGDVWRAAGDAPKVGLHVDLSLIFDAVAA